MMQSQQRSFIRSFIDRVFSPAGSAKRKVHLSSHHLGGFFFVSFPLSFCAVHTFLSTRLANTKAHEASQADTHDGRASKT